MNTVDPKKAPYQVVCVCGGYGFPLGTASAARITMVGKALQAAGIDFQLLHCGPSPVTINTQRSGSYEGIRYQYTTSVRRPNNPLARALIYLWATAELTARLPRFWSVRRSTLVYLYVMDGPLNLYVGLLCGCLGLAVVQELCEWVASEPTCSRFNRWLYRGPIFQLATGALAISKVIEERVKERACVVNPALLTHRLPVIVDAAAFIDGPPGIPKTEPRLPTFLYCGTWLRDVFFLIRVFAEVRRAGYHCNLSILGGCVEQKGAEILQYASDHGLSSSDITVSGCVDPQTLRACYRGATALLMPLWDDDRSISRLPNKMGEYLASGRPVITANIGDLTEFLVDNVNGYLSEPGSEPSFVERVIDVIRDPARADRIGAAGRKACLTHLDYRAHVKGLRGFVGDCLENVHRARSAAPRRSQVSALFGALRNTVCEGMALAMIAAGYVSRARRRAFTSETVTAIYFHNPRPKLLAKCIRWLQKYNYHFISLDDLRAFLYDRQELPRGAVWLSFDDGYKEWMDRVLPLIHRENIPVTLFIPPGIIEGDGQFPWLKGNVPNDDANRQSLNVDQLKRIAEYPEITIASHTVHHIVTPELSRVQAEYELGESKRVLESWTQKPVQYFAYPEGRFDGRETPVLRSLDYLLAATTESSFITRQSDPYRLPRFSVADEISFPEAICNMVGVWRPARTLKRWSRAADRFLGGLASKSPDTACVGGIQLDGAKLGTVKRCDPSGGDL